MHGFDTILCKTDIALIHMYNIFKGDNIKSFIYKSDYVPLWNSLYRWLRV